MVDFDMRLIDLFQEMDKRTMTIGKRIENEFLRVRDMLERVPTRMELFPHMEDEVYRLCLANSAKNPFRNYMRFLKRLGALTMEEHALLDGIGAEFLQMLETTSMSKVYKMPVLYTFYNDGDVRMRVTDEELLTVWKAFFEKNGNWKDIGAAGTYQEYCALSDQWHIRKMHEMPLRFLLESGKGFFVEEEGCALALRDDLQGIIAEAAFCRHMKDILDYRTVQYYRSRYVDKAEGLRTLTTDRKS